MQSHNTITLTGSRNAADPSVDVTIPRELGPVRLLREIGRGGMGVVYLGRHRMLDRDVAVKFLLHAVAGPDDPGFAGFLEGTRAAARVEHPGLTTIHHADVVDGIPYLVMQYIDGPTLGEVLNKTGPLSLSALFAVVDAVSEAIGELHDREIVHRDIKPANILLDREGHVFVTDFGLACSHPRAQRGQTSTGLAGTPTYMAPEMFDGVISLRSDVYALGITSFELLTGKSPFGGTLDEVRDKHLRQALPVEWLQEQNVDAELIEVLERATHKEAMYRYKTARHFGAALKSGVATDEVLKDGASELHRLVARSLHKDSDATTPETAEKSPTSTYFARLSEIAGEKRAAREPSGKADLESSVHDENAEAPSVPPGDQAVELGSISADRLTGAAVPVVDVRCAHCGYNLRGLPGRGRCPECGTPIGQSLRSDLLWAADPAWLQRVYRGMTMLAVAGVLGVFVRIVDVPEVGPAALIHLSLDVRPVGVGSVFDAVISVAGNLLFLVGAFAVTTLDPRLSQTEQPIALRRFVRWSIVVLVALEACSYLIPTAVKQLGADADAAVLCETALLWASGLVFLCALVGICYYIATLAMRIPDSTLASRTRSRAIGFVVCVAICSAGGQVPGYAAATLAGTPKGVIAMIVLLMPVLAYAVLLLFLMQAYQKAFRKCLLDARVHAVVQKKSSGTISSIGRWFWND